MAKDLPEYGKMKVKNIFDFIEFFRDKRHYEFFRGQSNSSWELLPKIARSFPKGKKSIHWESFERAILAEFKKFAIAYLDKEPEFDLEWLMLGQHYGLPTRLLDWTSNPLKALFYAVSDNFNNDAAVFILVPSKTLLSVDKENTLQSFDSFFPIYPRMFDKRVIAQEASFTIFPLPKNQEVFQPLENYNFYSDSYHELIKIEIPKQSKKEILWRLDKLGINAKSLFPDLEGLSKYISWYIQDVMN